MFSKEDKLRSEMRHECELIQEEDIVVNYINSGLCVPFRRRVRRQLMLSDANGRSKTFLKSAYVIKKEKRRHLKYYYYMIHPFSNFRVAWELLMLNVLTLLLFTIPLGVVFPYKVFHAIKLILDIICYVDIIVTFNTGYQNIITTKIILSRTGVAKKYVLTWFLLDLVSSFNTDLVHLFQEHNTDIFKKGLTLHNISYYLSYLKLLRIFTILQYIERLRDYNQWSIYKFKMFKLIIMFILIFIWCMSLIHMVNQMPNSGNLHELSPYYILRNSERIVYMLLLFGSPGTTQHLPTVILEIFILTIGFTLQLVVVAQILQIVTKHSLSGNKYYQLTQQLEEFMRYKNLPDNIRARIMSYFDFRFQQSYYKEDEILKILSPQLRQEMLVHTYMNLLEKVNIFDDIPMAIICKIIYNMKQEIYLPSDVIVSAGTVGDSMYFIASGTVAVYTSTGKEICHLSDGANFGEIAIIMENEQRVASVVAIDCCEVFILHRKDFLKQIEKYPEIYARMRKMAQDRVRKTLVATFGVDDSDSEGDNISRKYSGRYLI